MTSLPGAGLARRQLPAVDHRQTGRRRSSAPRARPRGRPRRCQVNDDQLARRQLPGCRSTGTATRASRGDRGTMTSFPALALPAVDRQQTGRRRSSAPRARPRATSAPWGPWHDDQLARRWPCPASIVGTTGTAAHASRGDRGTMTSFPVLALPAVDRRQTGRRRSSAPRARPRGRLRRCQVNDDQLARCQLPGCRSTGTATRASRGDRGTLPSPGVSFPPSIIGALAGVDHRHRGDRGTMTSLPGGWPCPALALPAVSFPPSIVGTTGTAAGSTMTSFPPSSNHGDRGTLPAVDRRQTGRHRSSAPRARPRGER